jgi:hypothetical protein
MSSSAEKRIRRIVYCGEQLMTKRTKMWDARYQRACAEAQAVEELDEAMLQLHAKFPEIGLDKIMEQQQ